MRALLLIGILGISIAQAAPPAPVVSKAAARAVLLRTPDGRSSAGAVRDFEAAHVNDQNIIMMRSDKRYPTG